MHFSSSLLGLSAMALAFTSYAQAQDTAALPPPLPTDFVDFVYMNDGNGEIGTEHIPFNTCFASEHAFSKYSFLNMAPNNATVNFYTDSNCNDFAFGLDGYYGGYPGPARSFRWVGWSTESLGELFDKAPIQGQGDAAPGGGGGGGQPVGGKNPGDGVAVPAPGTGNDPAGGSHPPNNNGDNNNNNNNDNNNNNNNSTSSSPTSSTFFGGIVGSLVVLSVGGVVFWKTAGKKMVQDKGKSVLPYNRVGGRDGDILLTNNKRNQNSFEIGDEDDEDEVDSRRPHRSGRQERYRDDEQV